MGRQEGNVDSVQGRKPQGRPAHLPHTIVKLLPVTAISLDLVRVASHHDGMYLGNRVNELTAYDRVDHAVGKWNGVIRVIVHKH